MEEEEEDEEETEEDEQEEGNVHRYTLRANSQMTPGLTTRSAVLLVLLDAVLAREA